MGTTVGPLTSTQLRERALSGEVRADTLVARGTPDHWVTADRVAGLLTSIPSAIMSSPPENIPVEEPVTPVAIQEQSTSKELPPVPTTQVTTKEYKVLTQKDKWFSGKFDPAKLEEALNAYAEQGWVSESSCDSCNHRSDEW